MGLRDLSALISFALVGAACAAASDPADGSREAASIPTTPAPAGPSSPPTTTAPPAPFALDARTEMEKGALALRTNLPADAAECAALPSTGAPCADADGDGLVDAWENLVVDRMRPRIELDENEPMLSDTSARLVYVARVTPRPVAGVADRVVLAYITIAYSRDYGRCGFGGHNGDNERVVLELRVRGGDAVVSRAYTAAHEGSAADDGHVFVDTKLVQDLRFVDDKGEPRWLVFSSSGKHATYANVDICAAHSFIPCASEHCAADGVANEDRYRVLPEFVNAGEPDHHLVGDLTPLGFEGEDAWGTADFCGGLGGSSCASPNAEKLTVDPFP